MSEIFRPSGNLLLERLSLAERQRIFPHLELLELKHGTVLYEPHEPLRHAYFPVTGIVSVQCQLEDGDALEFQVIGDEGFFGIMLVLGGRSSPRRAIVHRGGHAYRLPARVLTAEFARSGHMYDLFLRYVQAVITQIAQTAVCNRHHTVEQQLCRWLLIFLDRLHTDSVTITHQRIAAMLDVRRESVTLAARKLQHLGAISCHRGEISVLDRPRLERLSCECYGVVQTEWARLLEADPLLATGSG